MQNVSLSSLIDGGQDTVNLCLANLILTGNATPFLHNGIISAKSHDDQLEEMIGLVERLSSEHQLSYFKPNIDLTLEVTLDC